MLVSLLSTEIPELSDAPYGVAPWLEIDGVKLPDSIAIMHYLGKKYNLAGKTDLEAAQIQGCVEFIRDVLRDIRPYILVKLGREQGDLEKLKKEVFLPKIENAMTRLTSIIKGSGNGFLFKSGLTYADFSLAEFVYSMLQREKDEISKYSVIIEHQKKVYGLPKIKEYISKRKETDF